MTSLLRSGIRSFLAAFRLTEFRPYLRTLGLVTALSLLSTAAEAVSLVTLVPIIQAVAVGNDLINRDLGPVSAAASPSTLMAVAGAGIAASLILRILTIRAQARLVSSAERTARRALVSDFNRADWPTQSGERASTLQLYSGYAHAFALRLNSFMMVLRSVAGLVVLLAGALLVQYQAAIIIGVLGVAMSYAMRPLSTKIRAAADERSSELRELSQVVEDLVRLGRENRVFGVGEGAEQHAHEVIDRYTAAERRVYILSGLTIPLYQSVGLGLALGMLVFAQATGNDSVPALGACALLLLRCMGYGQQLQSALQRMIEAEPAALHYRIALDLYQQRALPAGGGEIESINSLVLVDVEYRYDDGAPALRNISVALHAGEVIGIAGRSGAGKSTLAQILLRLRKPTAGAIAVDGRPIDSISYRSWFEHIAYVPQEVRILAGTLRENVRFHRSAISDRDIDRAMTDAGLSEFVASLPDGLDTVIGPGERDLSGGQAQRVGIARALAGRPSLIVLDEPTSALDRVNETVINEALGRLAAADRIVVVIAHRASTLAVCPRLVVISEGRVISDGPPQGDHLFLVDGLEPPLAQTSALP